MQAVAEDPVQTLVLLPLDQAGPTERRWLQNTIVWLKSSPTDKRAARLRQLAEGILADPVAKARFRQIWAEAFAPRLYAEAGLPEPTSLTREWVARLKRRLLPQIEDDLDLYSALN